MKYNGLFLFFTIINLDEVNEGGWDILNKIYGVFATRVNSRQVAARHDYHVIVIIRILIISRMHVDIIYQSITMYQVIKHSCVRDRSA